MKPAWKEEITIRSFDVDCKNQLKISSLCSYFQEVAGHHAEHLGFGFEHIRESGLVWVLSRFEMAFSHFPKWDDHVVLETWPAGNERLYYRREFMVTGQNGDLLISAASFWLLIKMQNRRPKLLPLPGEIEKHNAARFAIQVMPSAIPSPEPQDAVVIPVRFSDLDLNHHVNNTRYINWIIDLFPVEFHYHHDPEFFRIDIKQEVKANESVRIIKSGDQNVYTLEGKIIENDATCFQAIVKFRNR